jgi:hypothetical protein
LHGPLGLTHARGVSLWFLFSVVQVSTGRRRTRDQSHAPGPAGEITEITDADTINFDLFMVEKDGKEQPMVKITYKRKK